MSHRFVALQKSARSSQTGEDSLKNNFVTLFIMCKNLTFDYVQEIVLSRMW
jgi:hypothetical protein